MRNIVRGQLLGWAMVGAAIGAFPVRAWAGIQLLDNRLSIAAQAFSEFSVAASEELNSSHNQLFAGGFKQGDLAWQRNSLQIETNFRLAENLGPFSKIAFHFTPRLVWQGETDLDHRIPRPSDFGESRSTARAFSGRDYFENVTFRDAYLAADAKDMLGGDWSALLGQQQVVWGESDGFRLADTINPLDLSWHYFLEAFEDIRVPIPMARVFFFPNAVKTNQGAIEVVWKPAKFEPTDFGPVYSLVDPRQPRTYWAFPNVPTPDAQLGPGITVTKTSFIRNRVPNTDMSNGEIGVRGAWLVTGQDWAGDYLNGTQLHAYYFYTREQFPVGEVVSPTETDLVYPRESLVGFQFNQFLQRIAYWNDAAMVFRGEFLYTPQRPFTSTTTGKIVRTNEFQSVIGLERPTSLPFWADPGQWIRLSPPGRTTFAAVQWFQRIRDKGGSKGHQMDKVPELPSIFTVFVSQRWMAGEEFQPGLFFAYETAERHQLIQPSASYRYGDYLVFTLGSNIFWGDKHRRDGFFGPVLEKDEVFFKTTVQF